MVNIAEILKQDEQAQHSVLTPSDNLYKGTSIVWTQDLKKLG